MLCLYTDKLSSTGKLLGLSLTVPPSFTGHAQDIVISSLGGQSLSMVWLTVSNQNGGVVDPSVATCRITSE